MPIYEYKCSKCGKELEVLHKVSDPAPAECPECHAAGTLERMVSRTSFQLKGGGWYSDLYGSTKKSESSSSSGSSASASSSTSTPSTSSATSTTPSAPAAAPASTSGGSSGGGSSSGGSST